MTFPDGVQPERILVEYHPVRYVQFDLGVTHVGAPTFVQANGSFASGNAPLAVAYNNPVTAGNLLVAGVYAFALDGVTATASVADTQGNTWTRVSPYTMQGGGGSGGITVLTTIAGATGADTATLTVGGTSGGFLRILVHEFTLVTAVDAQAANSGTVYPLDSGAANTTATAGVLFGWGVADNGNTVAGAGYTIAATAGSESSEYQISSAAGTYHATYPGSGANSSWCCELVAFK